MTNMTRMKKDLFTKFSDKEYLVEGSVNLDDFNDRLELNLESEDYDSLGGFIIEHLDRLPELGDSITTEDGIRLVVESLDKTVLRKFMCICRRRRSPMRILMNNK